LKTNIGHLPENKQEELRLLKQVIAADRNVHMLILFGSFATGKWVEDKYTEDGITFTYNSDFDLLVVTYREDFKTQMKIEQAIKERCIDNNRVHTRVSPIFHGIKHVNGMLEYGNYFFADIKKEGIMLFDSGRYQLSEPLDLSPEEQKAKMQENFEQWFESGNEFLIDFTNAFERASYFNASFLLHQSVERYYTAILLTFTDYRPKEHDLNSLNIKAISADKRFAKVFPQEIPEQKDRFRLLVRAYIDARYRMKQYHITKEDLEYLGDRVQLLKELTKTICLALIEGV
jgi:uncharacterized protein